MKPGRLRIQHHLDGDHCMVVVAGELDIATAPQLVAAVAELAQAAPSATVDFGRVTFMDSCGLRGILKIRELCKTHGCELALTLGHPQMRPSLAVASAPSDV